MDVVAHDLTLEISVERHFSNKLQDVLHPVGLAGEVVERLGKSAVDSDDPCDGFFEVVTELVELVDLTDLLFAEVTDVLRKVRAAYKGLLARAAGLLAGCGSRRCGRLRGGLDDQVGGGLGARGTGLNV